jgi:hypothetical protein
MGLFKDLMKGDDIIIAANLDGGGYSSLDIEETLPLSFSDENIQEVFDYIIDYYSGGRWNLHKEKHNKVIFRRGGKSAFTSVADLIFTIKNKEGLIHLEKVEVANLGYSMSEEDKKEFNKSFYRLIKKFGVTGKRHNDH